MTKTLSKKPSNKISPAGSTIESEELLQLPVDQLLTRLNSSSTGLTSQEAERRLQAYGTSFRFT